MVVVGFVVSGAVGGSFGPTGDDIGRSDSGNCNSGAHSCAGVYGGTGGGVNGAGNSGSSGGWHSYKNYEYCHCHDASS